MFYRQPGEIETESETERGKERKYYNGSNPFPVNAAMFTNVHCRAFVLTVAEMLKTVL